MKISNVKDKKLEDIVAEGDEIFGKIEKYVKEKKPLDAMKKELFSEYKDFISTYPIVINYMMYGMYQKDVFSKWLLSLTKKMWLKESDFFEAQAKYAAMLMKKLNPNCSNKQIAEYRRQVNEQLEQGRRDFKEKIDLAKKCVEEEEEKALIERKADLKKLLENGGITEMQYRADIINLEAPKEDKRQAVIDYLKQNPL